MKYSISELLVSLNRLRRPGRYKRNKLRKKFFKYPSIGITGVDIPMEIAQKELKNQDIYLGASDLTDMLTSKVIYERVRKNLECDYDTFGIYISGAHWKEYIKSLKLRNVQIGSTRGYLFDDKNLSYLEYNIHPTHATIDLVGDSKFIENQKDRLVNNFEIVNNHIEWLYSADGHSIDIPIMSDRKPIEEMYPFLNGKSLNQYYEDFMESSASILLLIGPPGTGKTTFIRGLLQHCNISAMVSYDSNILEKDYVFANFIESNKSILVLEDADMFLKSRQDGNTMMHKFLNVGDGLVTTRNKKLVFSTNLPSIRDIDPALIRPGRCYDIITFSELNFEEAQKLAKKLGVNIENRKKEKWTISDIFFEQNTNTSKPINRKVGFI